MIGLGVFLTIALYVNSVAGRELETVTKILIYVLPSLVAVVGACFIMYILARIWFRLQAYRAEVKILQREADVTTVTAEQNQQVFIADDGDRKWYNPALETRAQFGQGALEATEQDRQRWIMFKQVQLVNHTLVQKLLAAGSNAIDQGQHPLLEEPRRPIPDHVDIESLLARKKPNLGSLILGVGENEEVIRADARQLFHILVAGSTRWGKSIFLQMFLYQLLHLDNIQVYLADLEENTFVDFGLPFAATKAEIEELLKMVWEECQHRKTLFTSTKERSFRTLEQYNAFMNDNLPYIFVFVDEINGVLDKASPDYSPEALTYLNTLGKRVAKYGVYLVASGQDLRANVMPSGIKNQFISMLQFKAKSGAQARNLIEDSQAHKITVKGRAFVQINEIGETMELQIPFIEQETIHGLRGHIPKDVTPYVFNPEMVVEVNIEPTPIEQETIDLYQAGASYRTFTPTLYNGQHGKFYNDKFRREILDQFNVPRREGDGK